MGVGKDEEKGKNISKEDDVAKKKFAPGLPCNKVRTVGLGCNIVTRN